MRKRMRMRRTRARRGLGRSEHVYLHTLLCNSRRHLLCNGRSPARKCPPPLLLRTIPSSKRIVSGRSLDRSAVTALLFSSLRTCRTDRHIHSIILIVSTTWTIEICLTMNVWYDQSVEWVWLNINLALVDKFRQEKSAIVLKSTQIQLVESCQQSEPCFFPND